MKPFCDIPIKKVPLPETESVRLAESNEPFVDLSQFMKDGVRISMEYAAAGLPDSITTAYLRFDVAKRLSEAQKLLPKGYRFEILDAWRPYGVQLALFENYKEQLFEESGRTLSDNELIRRTCEFVSYPRRDCPLSYVHSSGGAVDLTVVDEKGERLDMGTDFDDFSERAYTAWYEQEGREEGIRNNRRLLCNVMLACGFTNYPAEWWHYDFGDAFWGFYKGTDAIYSSEYEEKDVKDK